MTGGDDWRGRGIERSRGQGSRLRPHLQTGAGGPRLSPANRPVALHLRLVALPAGCAQTATGGARHHHVGFLNFRVWWVSVIWWVKNWFRTGGSEVWCRVKTVSCCVGRCDLVLCYGSSLCQTTARVHITPRGPSTLRCCCG
eukprot:1190657-Prorocentrum_minimum.AAC.7